MTESKTKIDLGPREETRITMTGPLEDRDQPEKKCETEEVKDSSNTSESIQQIRVLLVDDHKMMREGLRKIVNEQDDLIVVAEASDGKEAIELAQENQPDIIVMDVNMPVMDGITATQQIMSKLSGQCIIGLSLHDHKRVVKSMLNAGATAYLTKNEAFETLCTTIRSEAGTA